MSATLQEQIKSAVNGMVKDAPQAQPESAEKPEPKVQAQSKDDLAIPDIPEWIRERVDPYAFLKRLTAESGDLTPVIETAHKAAVPAKSAVTFAKGLPRTLSMFLDVPREAYLANVGPIIQGQQTTGLEFRVAPKFRTYSIKDRQGYPMLAATFDGKSLKIQEINRDTGKIAKPGEPVVIRVLDWLALGIDEQDQRGHVERIRASAGEKNPKAARGSKPKPKPKTARKPRKGPAK